MVDTERVNQWKKKAEQRKGNEKNSKVPLKGIKSVLDSMYVVEEERIKQWKKKKYKLHAIPTVRAEAEPLVRLTTGIRPVTLLPEADLGIPCIMRRGFIGNAAWG